MRNQPRRRAGLPGSSASPGKRPVFREVLEATREQAARNAWTRAKLASAFRHHCMQHHQVGAAKHLAEIKRQAIARVIELVPRRVRVLVDRDWHVGFLSVRWPGRGRLHLPPQALLREPA
jgi:hypothetical protein